MGIANKDETGWPPGYILEYPKGTTPPFWYRSGTCESQEFETREAARRDAWQDYHRRQGDNVNLDCAACSRAGMPDAPHYSIAGAQAIEIICEVVERAKLPPHASYCLGNAGKYWLRMGAKDEPLAEAKKLRDYAQWLVEALEVE